MKYRLSCLTPLLIGDGSKLAPIDYMVWKDQVNVLDQARIFRLLAKGPRLDNYLKQIKRADKLDFASWGGFAQNFAQRRVLFEHPGYTAYWERLRAEDLHIPTFITGGGGPYVPGSAVKGALRTGLVFARGSEAILKDVAAGSPKDRAPRHPGRLAEEQAVGGPGRSRLKPFAAADSGPTAVSSLKIHLLRLATLEKKGPASFDLRWKQSSRGSVEGRRPEDSTPLFAEMATPGTVFEGAWTEKQFYRQPEIVRALHWKEPLSTAAILGAANDHAAGMLAAHKQYAQWAGLALLEESIERLETSLSEARERGNACLLSMGWGGGFLSKAASLATSEDSYRQILGQFAFYSKALRAGMPFPKTRRIVFLENRPATLPGWTLLEIL
jgi:CRISPR-associated protein Csm5